MSIATDSKELEDPKDPDTCNIFALYKLLASEEQIAQMRTNYLAGGYGYGHAKQALYELLLERFSGARAKYNHLMAHPEEIEAALKIGQERAQQIAKNVLNRVRAKVGYGIK